MPVAPVASSDTSSPATTPTSVAPVVSTVASVVPSYTLLLAVMPVTVNGAGVMFAVVVRRGDRVVARVGTRQRQAGARSTVLPVPTFLLANAPVAPAVSSVDVVAGDHAGQVARRCRSMAAVVPSYTLLLAVMPVTVKGAAVMFAVVVGAGQVVVARVAAEERQAAQGHADPVPTFLVAKVPVGVSMSSVTSSPGTAPTRWAPVVSAVVVVLPS